MKHHWNQFKKLTNSLTFRLLTVCTLILITGLLTVTLSLFGWFQDKIQKDYRQLTRSTLSNIDTNFNFYMQYSKNLLPQWYHSKEGNLARLQPDFRIPENMGLLLDIQTIYGNIPYIQSVYSINTDNEVTFQSISGISFTIRLEERLTQRMLMQQEAAGSFCWSAPKLYDESTSVPLLALYYGEVPVTSSRYMGTIIMNIDLHCLSDTLFENSDDEFSFYVIDQYGNIIAHNHPEYCGENWADLDLIASVLSGEEEIYRVIHEDSEWEIQWLPSSQKGYYVVSQAPYHSELKQLMNMADILLAVVIIAIVLICALTLPIGHYLFLPFRRLIRDMKTHAVIEEKNEDEIAFLQRYYQKLSDDISSLKQRNEEAFIVKNLLINSNHRKIQNFLLKNKVVFKDQGYFVILVGICEKEGEDRNLQEYQILKETISRLFRTRLESFGQFTYLEISLRRMLFILSEQTGGSVIEGEDLYNILVQTDCAAEELIQSQLITILSKKAENGEVPCGTLFNDAEARMSTRMFLDDNRNTGFEVNVSSETDLNENFEQILAALLKQNQEMYHLQLENLLLLIADNPFWRFKDILIQLVEKILLQKEYTSSNVKNTFIQKDSIREQLEQLESKKELLLWFDMLYNEAVIMQQKVENYSVHSRMADVVDYIDNHYDDSLLNVNTLADRMHISSSYLGKLFREFAGCTVLEYLTRVRMEKARALLLADPDRDINKIAADVGYNNNAYFATAFKKYYGVSPSKMRDFHAINQK